MHSATPVRRGTLVLRLDRRDAPCAVHSFTHLALTRSYNGTPCPHHNRATLECDPGRPSYRFTPELTGKESYHRGVVALRNDNGNGTAFFFVHMPADLPKTSTIIGTITNGLPVLDQSQPPLQILNVLVGQSRTSGSQDVRDSRVSGPE
ncbi:peptidylprolyl isomerase [Kribbella sp. NPDC050124]|uniref:peptidylprolyl isomerase n=1 Tax=Kribbella sp. NPDC050124 TaxID=3364114 RepID=UPI0037AA00BE